jgi:hypothetical protein
MKHGNPSVQGITLASWESNVTGTDEAWARNEKASLAYIIYFTDRKAFAELKELKESGMVKDSLLPGSSMLSITSSSPTG